MTVLQEIVRAVFVAFGCMEIMTNGNYLLKSNGMIAARRQHGEIPQNATEKQLRTKVICMFTTGVLFLAAGILNYMWHTYMQAVFIGAAATLTLYSVVEALYYRYWKTTGFCVASMLMLAFVISVG